jgi:protein AroM
VLFHVTKAVMGESGRRLGVLLPDADQVDHGMRRWTGVTPNVRIEPVSPYGDTAAIDGAARKLAG